MQQFSSVYFRVGPMMFLRTNLEKGTESAYYTSVRCAHRRLLRVIAILCFHFGILGNVLRRLGYFLYRTCPLHTIFSIEGVEKEGSTLINWSMVTCKMAATVAGTTLGTTGPVPADTR